MKRNSRLLFAAALLLVTQTAQAQKAVNAGVMILNEESMYRLHTRPCEIRDSSHVGLSEIRATYLFTRPDAADTTQKLYSEIRFLGGEGKAVQTDMRPFWNTLTSSSVRRGSRATDPPKAKFLTQHRIASTDEFIFMTCDYGSLRADICCGDFFKSDAPLYYRDSIRQEWTLTDSIATIGGHACNSAVSDFHGRRWTAWYTTEIPIQAGPWKLCGLPGLILRAETDDGAFSFEAVEVRETQEEMYAYGYGKGTELKTLSNWLKYKRICHEAPFQTFAAGREAYVMLKKGDGTSSYLDESWTVPLLPLEIE